VTTTPPNTAIRPLTGSFGIAVTSLETVAGSAFTCGNEARSVR
jgi:hypothetical protein